MNAKIVTIGAVLMALVGLVWFFQGIGLIHGSVMTSETEWAWIGGSMVLIASAYLLIQKRKR